MKNKKLQRYAKNSCEDIDGELVERNGLLIVRIKEVFSTVTL